MKSEKSYTIYMHKNKTNGKVYIGQTSQIPERRWQNGYGYIENKYFYRAIQKYGWKDGFEHIILFENLSLDEANEKEIELIKLYNSTKKENGYNFSPGGSGEKCCERGKNSSAKVVICENMEFECAKDCAEYYDIKYTTMKSWLNKSRPMPKEYYDMGLHYKDCEMSEYTIKDENKNIIGENNPVSIPVYCDGIKFANSRECAEYCGINMGTLKNWINGNNSMPQEWFDRNLHKEGKTMNDYKIQKGYLTGSDNPISKVLFCDNRKYVSIMDFANTYKLNYHTVISWLTGKNKMPQEWFDRNLHLDGQSMDDINVQTGMPSGENHSNSIKVICENICFNSITECSKYYNIKTSVMSAWLREEHKMPQSFIDKGLRYYKENENYESSNDGSFLLDKEAI